MKNLLVSLTLLSMMVLKASYLQAQDQFLIHIGAAFPVGDFASEDPNINTAGGANFGLNFGLKYVRQLKDAVGFIVGTDFSINGLKPEVKDDAKALMNQYGVQNPEIDFYKFWNIPISAGLNLKTNISDMTDLYFDACIALNFLKLTDMVVKANNQTVLSTFDWAAHVGYKFGAGLLVNDKIAISASYFSLGKHDIKGTSKSGNHNEDIDGEIKIKFITVTLGLVL